MPVPPHGAFVTRCPNREEFGKVDRVLNVAGIGGGGPLADVDMTWYDDAMDVDLRGVLHETKHGIRAILQGGNGSSIVNWSSLAGLNASLQTVLHRSVIAAMLRRKGDSSDIAGVRATIAAPPLYETEETPFGIRQASLRRAGSA